MCLFWAKNHMDKVLWGKHEGDGRTLLPWQSTVSGFMAACLGPTVTNPFDVIKTRMMAQVGDASIGIACAEGTVWAVSAGSARRLLAWLHA